MKYTVVVEISKGSDRRIHMAYDKSGFIDLGLIKDQIPINDGIMPVTYGYLLNYINEKEKDNVDALIFSEKEYKTGEEIEVEIFGMLVREDGDHKVLAKDATFTVDSYDQLPASEKQILSEYFGYKSKISSIENKGETEKYLTSCKEITEQEPLAQTVS